MANQEAAIQSAFLPLEHDRRTNFIFHVFYYHSDNGFYPIINRNCINSKWNFILFKNSEKLILKYRLDVQ